MAYTHRVQYCRQSYVPNIIFELSVLGENKTEKNKRIYLLLIGVRNLRLMKSNARGPTSSIYIIFGNDSSTRTSHNVNIIIIIIGIGRYARAEEVRKTKYQVYLSTPQCILLQYTNIYTVETYRGRVSTAFGLSARFSKRPTSAAGGSGF